MKNPSLGLLSLLKAYRKRGIVPFHMPGHKRNTDAAPYLSSLGGGYDITEIDGFDDLHHPTGILRQGMETAARLFGCDRSFFLVGGSTCGILAGIRAATQPGDSIVMARNCHQSVYHAVELCGLRPRFLTPPVEDGFGILGSLPPEQAAQALERHPDVSLLVLTSPTYDGVLTDVKSICTLAHARGIPVLVDAAHGAHLGFSKGFPGSAVQDGADLVIQSLHKTLPSLTQTAIAHISGARISPDAFARELRVFETSSPSYLLLASIDSCVRFLEENRSLFETWERLLSDFDGRVQPLRHLRVFRHGGDKETPRPAVFGFDPGKLLISTMGTSCTGPMLMGRLRREFDMELEMASANSALAMTSLLTTEAHLARLADALCALDRDLAPAPPQTLSCLAPSPPRQVRPPGAVRSLPRRLAGAKEAVGRVMGEYIWVYPPGIPLLIPGERLDASMLAHLNALEGQGIEVRSASGGAPRSFEVIEKAVLPPKGNAAR
ncbi:MAG: aminotransferase class I/II-fold pyridoxal phosphate-dependent enzyme [Oscillospiraceae bacterium]|jgi:arginine decarboxylase